MKIILCLAGLVAVVFDLSNAEPEPATPEVRKTRHPSSAPTSYNSIVGTDSETLSKLQNQVAPSVQIPLKPIGSPIKSSESAITYGGTSNQPSSPFIATSAGQNFAGQYYVAMTPQGTGNQMLAPATTPLIMQYINPQGQPTGGLQYIQLLRPVLYPYNNQYVQPSYVQQHQQSAAAVINQHPHLHHPQLSPSHYSTVPSPTSPPITPPTTQSNFVPFQPSSLQQYAAATTASHHHLPAPLSYSNPVGQYSSPVVSYYPPRISLINSPGDINLNTNEYMPSPGDHVFIKGVKAIRA